MLVLFSDSFITAARMDGFSYAQGPVGSTRLAEGPQRFTKQSPSALAWPIATLRRVLAGLV